MHNPCVADWLRGRCVAVSRLKAPSRAFRRHMGSSSAGSTDPRRRPPVPVRRTDAVSGRCVRARPDCRRGTGCGSRDRKSLRLHRPQPRRVDTDMAGHRFCQRFRRLGQASGLNCADREGGRKRAKEHPVSPMHYIYSYCVTYVILRAIRRLMNAGNQVRENVRPEGRSAVPCRTPPTGTAYSSGAPEARERRSAKTASSAERSWRRPSLITA